MFQNSKGNVTVEERHELAEETTCSRDSMCVRPLPHNISILHVGKGQREKRGSYPVFKSPVSVLFEHFESFGGGFIEMLTLSDFFEDPGFDDCAAGDHGGICARLFDRIIKVDIRVHVSVSTVRLRSWEG